jgi:outer membrane autotransporter protein
MLLAAVAFAAFAPNPAFAQCSPSGALAPGSTVTCNGSQTTTEGQGPGANNVSVFVNDGATVDVSNANAISVGDNATVTLGTSGPTVGGTATNAAVMVRTTTNASAGNGNYGDGSNTIDIGYNSTLVINRNASVIAIGTQQQSEAINPYGSGNTIINYGLIQGGPSSAINFQDVGSDASSPHNVVENYGTIQLSPVGSVNPISGGQAVSSAGTVGIDFINETGGKVIGNLVFQAGDDHVTLNPGSSISGDLDGEGGTNLLTLNASGTSADTFTGEIKNFQTVDKTGAGTWTLTGAIGNNSFTGVTPLAVNIIGGTLVLNGNNTAFNGSIAINPGTSLALPGSDPTATLEARAQSLPPLITDHGILLINQFSPDGIQPVDGTYAGVIQGTGTVTKIGIGTVTLSGVNSYTGGTNLNVGTLAVSTDTALGGSMGALNFNGGSLRLLSSFNLAASRAIVLNGPGAGLAGGGTIDTNGFQTNIAQAISGAGGLNKAGAGLLVLTGTNSYAGGTTISGGMLQLGNGGTAGSIVGNVTDNGILAFNRSDATTYSGIVSGTGALFQAGAGTTILNANSSYTGATSISAGTLAVGDATHSTASLFGGGDVGVASGAMLGGYGTVAGNVSDNGAIAAGNALPIFTGGPAGAFTIGGSLLNNAVVNLAGSSIGNSLVVQGNYTSVGGALSLNTLLNAGGPLSNQVTDRLLVGGNGSGSTLVQVNGSGAGASTGLPIATNGISIIQVGGASSANAFTLSGGYVSNGTPFQYHLIAYGPGSPNGAAAPAQNLVGNPGGYWDYRLQTPYVTPAGPVAIPVQIPATPAVLPVTAQVPVPAIARPAVAPQVPAYITAPMALFNAGFQDIDSLHRRLGEIRDGPRPENDDRSEGFFRVLGGQFQYVSDRSFGSYGYNSSQDYSAIQFGLSRIAVDTEDGTLRVGLAGTIGQLSFEPQAVDGASKGRFHTETLAGIATWQSTAGWYVDAVVSGGLFDGTIVTPARGQTAGMNGTSMEASIEGGYPIPLDWQNVSLEPQAQLAYQRLSFGRRTDIDGIDVKLGNPSQGVLRTGARLTRKSVTEDGMVFTPYLKANVLQGLGGGSPVDLSGVSFGTGHFGTALQLGAGITGAPAENLSVYGDVAWQKDVAAGGSRGWAFNGGLRYVF